MKHLNFLRIHEREEREGLDLAECGGYAYEIELTKAQMAKRKLSLESVENSPVKVVRKKEED